VVKEGVVALLSKAILTRGDGTDCDRERRGIVSLRKRMKGWEMDPEPLAGRSPGMGKAMRLRMCYIMEQMHPKTATSSLWPAAWPTDCRAQACFPEALGPQWCMTAISTWAGSSSLQRITPTGMSLTSRLTDHGGLPDCDWPCADPPKPGQD